MLNAMNKIILFSIGFCTVCLIFSGYCIKQIFNYQDELVKLNQKNYELNQTIEMYKIATGDFK